jgi:chromosome segregation ATPase
MVRTLIEIQGGRVNVRETPEETTVTVTVDDLTTALTLTRTSRQFNRARVIELEAERDEACQRSARRERRIKELVARNEELVARNEELSRDIAGAHQRGVELEAELDRYRKAHVCTSRCSENSHVVFEGVRLVKDVKDELDVAVGTLKVREDQVTILKQELARHQAAEARLTEELAAERKRADENREWAERAETRLEASELTAKGTRLDLDEAQKGIAELAQVIGAVSGAVHGPPIHRVLRTGWTSWSESDAAALTQAIREVRRAVGSPSFPSEETSQA